MIRITIAAVIAMRWPIDRFSTRSITIAPDRGGHSIIEREHGAAPCLAISASHLAFIVRRVTSVLGILPGIITIETGCGGDGGGGGLTDGGCVIGGSGSITGRMRLGIARRWRATQSIPIDFTAAR
jgi:hypothetical protein